MYAILTGGTDNRRESLSLLVGRVVLLMLPLLLLLLCSVRAHGAVRNMLWLGALFQVLGCCLTLFGRQVWRGPTSVIVIMLYVIAFGWIVMSTTGRDDWLTHLAQANLLIVPLGYFSLQCLMESGAPALRRARRIAHELAQRSNWPENLNDCRLLPEVQALREAVHGDAAPALELLSHPRTAVRVAALAALAFRQSWRPGQEQVVLHLSQRAVEPEVRAAAINALANVEDRNTIEALAEFMRDSSPVVRKTAAEALLGNTEKRWPWLRLSVHRALTDSVGQDDGPLRQEGEPFSSEAVADLTAWAAEKGIQSFRAALTLGCHYHRLLSFGSDAAIVRKLRHQLTDSRTPALLRLELARVLYAHQELDAVSLRQLIDSANPAPLRLIAVEALLNNGQSAEAIAALHELARVPNREIALGIAQVVQRRLGLDLGLPRGRPLPGLHSREAAEVARRVLVWAAHQDTALQNDEADWQSLDELHDGP